MSSNTRKPFRVFLVTGGAGFIGRHLIEALLEKGKTVRVIDNFSNSRKEDLAPVRDRIRLFEADIRDRKAVRRAMKGVDGVFHLAAIRSVMRSVEDPVLGHAVNATATLELLEEAQRAGVKHFIFTSSSAVYGQSLGRAQRENDPTRPISPYGVAKLCSEHYARYFFEERKLPTTSVRIFNIYGPRQNPESQYSLAVPGLLSKILTGKPPVIDGDGRQMRDFVYIGDALDAFWRILGNPKAFGKVYNLGSGKTLSINRLTEELLRQARSKLKPVHGPGRKGDPRTTLADIGRIRSDLGWRPRVSIAGGLRETVAWALEKGESS